MTRAYPTPNAIMREYLVEIHFLQPGYPTVNPRRLAQHLGVAVTGVLNVLKRLDQAGYVHSWPYEGVTLTEDGRFEAELELRRRRWDQK